MIKGDGTQPGIDFVDIATTGSLPNTIMGVTKEGRLLAIDKNTGAITHNVTDTVVQLSSYDSYDADPSDDGNTFLYTQVEGNKDSSTQYPFVAIRTNTGGTTPNQNSMVALQKSSGNGFNQNLDIITGPVTLNDLLESSIKVHFHENDIFIYKLTSHGSVDKGAYKLKVGSAIPNNLFSTTDENTMAFTVSNTGKAYHFTGNDLYSKDNPDDNTFDNNVFDDTKSIATSDTPTYVQLGVYGNDHIFLLMKSDIVVNFDTTSRPSGSSSTYTKCGGTYRNNYQAITNQTLQDCKDICDQSESCTSFSRPSGILNDNASVCLFSSNDQESMELNVYDTYFKDSSFSSSSGNVCPMFDSSPTTSVQTIKDNEASLTPAEPKIENSEPTISSYTKVPSRMLSSDKGFDLDITTDPPQQTNDYIKSRVFTTLQECKDLCNQYGNCKGFGRASAVPDDGNTYCYFKYTGAEDPSLHEYSGHYHLYLKDSESADSGTITDSSTSISRRISSSTPLSESYTIHNNKAHFVSNANNVLAYDYVNDVYNTGFFTGTTKDVGNADECKPICDAGNKCGGFFYDRPGTRCYFLYDNMSLTTATPTDNRNIDLYLKNDSFYADGGATNADGGATNADGGATNADGGATNADGGATNAEEATTTTNIISSPAMTYTNHTNKLHHVGINNILAYDYVNDILQKYSNENTLFKTDNIDECKQKCNTSDKCGGFVNRKTRSPKECLFLYNNSALDTATPFSNNYNDLYIKNDSSLSTK
jgi:hypothetical protein